MSTEERKDAFLRELAVLRVADPVMLGQWLKPLLPDPPLPKQQKSGLHAARRYLTDFRKAGLVKRVETEAPCWTLTPKGHRYLRGIGHEVPPPYRVAPSQARHELGVSRFVVQMQLTGLGFVWEDNNRRYGKAHRVPDVLFRLGEGLYGIMEYDRGTVMNKEMGHRLVEYLSYVREGMIVLVVTEGAHRCQTLRSTLWKAFEQGGVDEPTRESYLFTWEGNYEHGIRSSIWYDVDREDSRPLILSKWQSKVWSKRPTSVSTGRAAQSPSL